MSRAQQAGTVEAGAVRRVQQLQSMACPRIAAGLKQRIGTEPSIIRLAQVNQRAAMHASTYASPSSKVARRLQHHPVHNVGEEMQLPRACESAMPANQPTSVPSISDAISRLAATTCAAVAVGSVHCALSSRQRCSLVSWRTSRSDGAM